MPQLFVVSGIMPAIFRRQKQEDPQFEASLDYTARPFTNKQTIGILMCTSVPSVTRKHIITATSGVVILKFLHLL